MRVAFHAPLKPPNHPTPSGDRLMARLIMKAATLAGHDVRLVSRLRTWDGTGDERRQRRICALGAKLATRLIETYRTHLPDARPDVWLTYHLYHKAPDWLGPAVTSALGIPYVVVEPSVSHRQANGPWRLGHCATLDALAQADAVLSMSVKDHSALQSIVTKPGCLAMFPPFIATAPFTRARELRQSHREELSDHLRLDPTVPWFVVVAMMRDGDKLQSYEALARSLAMVRDLDWALLVAGDGPARSEVMARFRDLSTERVRYLGVLETDDLARLYAAGDVYLWPAIREAYGMALLEAQAAGCPVVAGRFGGVPDIVVDGVTGLVVSPRDDAGFATAIRLILADPEKRAAMGRAAAQHVEDHHSLGVASKRLGDVLLRVAHR